MQSAKMINLCLFLLDNFSYNCLMKHALAHEDESSGTISATMHIDPADHPIAGKEAHFYFTFNDTTGKFDLKHCNCSLTIYKGETQIDQQAANVPQGVLSSFGSQPLYTKIFAEAGDYELHFSGTPKDGADFEPFMLHYDVAVIPNGMSGAEHHAMAPSQHIGHIIIFGGGLVASIILLVRNYLQARKSRSKDSN
jgi:hypothetical protein